MGKKVVSGLLLQILFLNTLLLSSCAFRDIDKRAFIVTIGVDPGIKKSYRVTLKVAIPNPDIKKGESDFQLVSEEDEFIGEAMKRLSAKVEKQLDFSHTKIILLGDEIAKNHPVEALNWFLRKEEIQRVALVAVARPNALSLMKIQPKGERTPSDFFFLAFEESGAISPHIITTHLFDLYRRFYEPGLDPILPIAEQNDQNGIWIRKAYLFNKNRMKQELDTEETGILNLLAFRKSQTGYLIGEEADHFHLNAGSKRTVVRLNAEEKEGKRKIKIAIRLVGTLDESKEKVAIDQIPHYEALAEKAIKGMIEKLIHLLQSNQVDPLGLGLQYRAKHPSEADWKRWQKEYPTMPVEVEAHVKIFSTGAIHR